MTGLGTLAVLQRKEARCIGDEPPYWEDVPASVARSAEAGYGSGDPSVLGLRRRCAEAVIESADCSTSSSTMALDRMTTRNRCLRTAVALQQSRIEIRYRFDCCPTAALHL